MSRVDARGDSTARDENTRVVRIVRAIRSLTLCVPCARHGVQLMAQRQLFQQRSSKFCFNEMRTIWLYLFTVLFM